MHFIHEINWFECFLHKTSVVFQNSIFPEFQSIECVFLPIENSLNFLSLVSLGSIDPQLALDQLNLFFD